MKVALISVAVVEFRFAPRHPVGEAIAAAAVELVSPSAPVTRHNSSNSSSGTSSDSRKQKPVAA